MEPFQNTNLVVNDRQLGSGLWQRNSRNSADELSQLLADFESTVAGDGPQQTEDQRPRDVAFQLIVLTPQETDTARISATLLRV